MRCFFYWKSPNRLILAGILFLAIAGIQGCAKEPAPFLHTNVLLISIDTCRADHIQPYSDDKAQTPNLKAIAQDGIWFEDAVTPVPLTLPAHCSLLTGLYPIQHGVRNNYNFALSGEAITLPELFLESGYSTAGIISSILITRREGIGQGFDYFDDQFTPDEYKALQPLVERKAERVIASATTWLQSHLAEQKPKPFFLFLHFYDPHMIYQPPAPFDTLYTENPYDGELAYVDACIGQLMGFVKERKLYDDLLIVIVGDHGEGLRDHGDPTHGLFLYEEAVRIPLIVKLPKDPNRLVGKSNPQSAGLIDVMPTLIDLCGLGKTDTSGISLKPWLLDGKAPTERNLILETQYPLTYNWSPTYALRNSHWKYIHAPQPELYSLTDDPREKTNRYLAGDTPLQAMQVELENRLVEMAQSVTLNSSQQITTDRMETLASLGYAAGGASPDIIAPKKSLPDPKEKLEVYLLIDRGLGFLARRNDYQSIELFEEAMQKDPENPTPYANLGLAYARTNQWDKAIEFTRKAVELSPQNLLAQLQLTRLYVLRNQFEEGRKRLEALLKDFPQLAEAHYQLGELYSRQNEPQKALSEFELTKRWMPDMPGIDELIEKAKKDSAG